MTRSTHITRAEQLCGRARPAARAWLVLALYSLITFFAIPALQGQSFNVLYEFTGAANGAHPEGVTLDRAGNLYGTTLDGGNLDSSCGGCGTVFKLKHSDRAWTYMQLYAFDGGYDGAWPTSRVAIAQDGTLYGTTEYGGGLGCNYGFGCGTVFHLNPSPSAPRSALEQWHETVIYAFLGQDGGDGYYPQGNLVFDAAGNIYGTTLHGGSTGGGIVYELTPSYGTWAETALYSAGLGGEGSKVVGGVVFDRLGNLYSATENGQFENCGSVFQLSPSDSGWLEQTLLTLFAYDCTSQSMTIPRPATLLRQGKHPFGVTIDAAGNVIGSSANVSDSTWGMVWELSPENDGWNFTYVCIQGCGTPNDVPVVDQAGNIYGTTSGDGAYGQGTVFKLTISDSGWTYTDLHDFDGSDGSSPRGLAVDPNGNVYGVALEGGSHNAGVVWEITR